MIYIFFLLALLIAAPVDATSWYVTKAGADSNCKTSGAGNPKLTIQYALNCVIATGSGAGHEVVVADSTAQTYTEQFNAANGFPSGAAGNPFVLRAQTYTVGAGNIIYGGTLPIIRLRVASGHNFDFPASSGNPQYFTVRGFDIQPGTSPDDDAFHLNGNGLGGITIEDNYIHDGANQGILGAPGITVRRNKFKSIGDDIQLDHCIYKGDHDTTSTAVIEYNEFELCAHYGVQLSWSGDADNTIVRFNVFHDNRAAIYVGPGSNRQVYGNVIYGNAAGIDSDTAAGGVTYANNTIYGNTRSDSSYNGYCFGYYTGLSGGVYRNNFCVANSINTLPSSGVTASNNILSGVASDYFVNAAAGNFRLKAPANAAIDAGTNTNCPTVDIIGTPRPQGTLCDVGAYEYASAAPTPPTVVVTGPVATPTFTTSTASQTISGTYTSGGGTSPSIAWSCDRCGSGSASGTTSWSFNVTLVPGVNIIQVNGTDSGGLGSDTITITYTPTYPGNALVGAWGFESNGTDSSGNSNTASLLNGATYAAGKFGQALSLDGVNDHASVADANSLDFTQSFTFTAWVFPTAVHSDYRALIVKNPFVQRLYASIGDGYCGNGGIAGFANMNGTSGPQFAACRTTPLPINTWSHVGFSYDGGNLRLTVNGVLATTATATGIMEPTTGNLTIGGSSFPNEFFEGRIAEVRVYNWAIPLSSGSNTTPGAACVFGNPLDTAEQSIVRDMNCPVIPAAPPVLIKIPASATALKVGAASTLKFGAQ